MAAKVLKVALPRESLEQLENFHNVHEQVQVNWKDRFIFSNFLVPGLSGSLLRVRRGLNSGRNRRFGRNTLVCLGVELYFLIRLQPLDSVNNILLEFYQNQFSVGSGNSGKVLKHLHAVLHPKTIYQEISHCKDVFDVLLTGFEARSLHELREMIRDLIFDVLLRCDFVYVQGK